MQAVTDEIRVVVAEDHPFFRDGLRAALAGAPGVRIVGEAADGESALEMMQACEPDVAILDIGLPRLDGVAVVRKARERRLPVEIVFLTVHTEEDMFEAALELGVKGYLLKDCTAAEIVRCVDAVAAGLHYTAPAMTSYLVRKAGRVERFAERVPGLRLLTAHERSILRRIAHDRTSKEIAQELGIASKTVDAHRSIICGKLKIHGKHVLRRFARRHRADL
jgi:DNA-binding NarL/FixJ family response regulator